MKARDLEKAGFTGLVSVIPPDAKLAPSSTVKDSMRGKTPGIRKRGGEWVGYPYTRIAVPPGNIDAWGANVGILAKDYPAIDIDIDDNKPLSLTITQEILDRLGHTRIRRSRGTRLLLPFRTKEPFRKKVVLLREAERTHRLEVLGEGQQYLIAGRHPSGAMYSWVRPVALHPDQLPFVTEAQVDELLEHLVTTLPGLHGVVEAEYLAKGRGKNAVSQKKLAAPSAGQLVDLVRALPNRFPDRETYIRVAAAIKAAGGTFKLFAEWALKWEGGENDPDVIQTDWDSLQPPFAVGWPYLQHLAEEAGAYSPAEDGFEVIENPETPKTPPPARKRLPFTDDAIALQIEDTLRNRIRYMPQFKQWARWVGHRWAPDEAGSYQLEIRSELRGVAAQMIQAARAQSSKEDQKPFLAAARKVQSTSGINNISSLLKHQLTLVQDELDHNPWLLNTPSGPINLKTGELQPIEEGAPFLRSTDIAPAPGPHPMWDAFLDLVTGGDKELQAHLQRVMGYCLTGSVHEKTLWFVWGSQSDTGKSTLIRTMAGVLGSYAASIAVQAFMGRYNDNETPAALAAIAGSRLVTATEPKKGMVWDEHHVKAVTGDDVINARPKYGHPIQFMPTFKVMVVGNHEPHLAEVDDAMLRRIRIVPFEQKIPRDDQVEKYDQALLKAEGPQILQWMIEGCLLWQKEGLGTAAAVDKTTIKYAEEEDALWQWIEEECVVGEDEEVASADLFRSWTIWCKAQGEKPGTKTGLVRSVKAKLPGKVFASRTSRQRGLKGIGLRDRETGI